MPRPRAPLNVAVQLRASTAAGRMLDGVLSVARAAGWELTDQVDAADAVLSTAARPPGVAVPWVRVVTTGENDQSEVTAAADVRPDFDAVGRLAAVHFLDRGFQAFARVGCHADTAAAFDDAATAAGHSTPFICRGTGFQPVPFPQKTRVGNPCHDDLRAWIAALPRPLAVLAGDDRTGRRVIEAARRAGLRVPFDVAVLGVGDDRVVCELTPVPLSSIDVSPFALGRAAATRLRAILRGRPPAGPTLVPPGGVVRRASTDTLATDDADVIAAVRFIRERTGGPLRAGDIVRAVGLDRRTLERRFIKSLGRSPMEVLRRHRVDRAAELLRTTALPLAEIAAACGFRLPQHLAVAFKRQTGQTPGDYRAVMHTG